MTAEQKTRILYYLNETESELQHSSDHPIELRNLTKGRLESIEYMLKMLDCTIVRDSTGYSTGIVETEGKK